MTTYTDLPAFRDGDLLSASRLNAVATNVDIAVGLDEQRVWPIEAGANVKYCDLYSRAADARFGGDEVEYYIAHNGDKLLFHHVVSGISSNATVVYNSQTFSNLAQAADHVLTLSSLPRYKIVKVRITCDTPGGLFVRKLYSYSSNAPTFGSMLDFANGGASRASDLNQIMEITKRGIAFLNQPVAGMYNIDLNGASKQLARERNGYYGYIRHKHDKLYLWIRCECNGYGEDDYFIVTYNGEEVWKFSPYQESKYFTTFAGLVDLPSGINVGTLYPVEVRKVFEQKDRKERFTLWAMYETPTTLSGTISAVDRWAHGDTANGDADGPPQLDSMSDALGGFGTLRWTNPACRAACGWIPNYSGDCSADNEITDELASVRVHRWLAYENILKQDGKRAPVTLQYQTGSGATFTGTTLPEVESPSYYDLDGTPVKPGMYFRLIGSKFLIQTPGYEGE